MGDDTLPVRACLAETLSTYPVKYTTLQVVDWKKAQREDPALSTLIKNLRYSKEDFMWAMHKVLDPKAARAGRFSCQFDSEAVVWVSGVAETVNYFC